MSKKILRITKQTLVVGLSFIEYITKHLRNNSNPTTTKIHKTQTRNKKNKRKLHKPLKNSFAEESRILRKITHLEWHKDEQIY